MVTKLWNKREKAIKPSEEVFVKVEEALEERETEFEVKNKTEILDELLKWGNLYRL